MWYLKVQDDKGRELVVGPYKKQEWVDRALAKGFYKGGYTVLDDAPGGLVCIGYHYKLPNVYHLGGLLDIFTHEGRPGWSGPHLVGSWIYDTYAFEQEVDGLMCSLRVTTSGGCEISIRSRSEEWSYEARELASAFKLAERELKEKLEYVSHLLRHDESRPENYARFETDLRDTGYYLRGEVIDPEELTKSLTLSRPPYISPRIDAIFNPSKEMVEKARELGLVAEGEGSE